MIMIVIYISQRAWRPSNRIKLVNYDAGIVLIDLHINNKQPEQYKSATLNTGATSCQRRTEPAEQQPATSAFYGND